MEGMQREMPRYKCHKEVHALKIGGVTLHAEGVSGETDGSATIIPEDQGFLPFKVSADYVRKHKPTSGGYFVVYADGYQSFSPEKAFEEGYTRI